MSKSSSLAYGAKTYYRPIEAAIRWCGLLRFEQRILATLGQRATPDPSDFPRWPLLRLYAERIYDALTHCELPGGKAGIVLESQRPALDDPELTVRHVDLKAWMSHYYPGDRPGFLFDDIERAVHPAVSMDTLNILLAEREATKAQFSALTQVHEALRATHDALVKEHVTRSGGDESAREPSLRSETTYLNMNGTYFSRFTSDGRHPLHLAAPRNASPQLAQLASVFEYRGAKVSAIHLNIIGGLLTLLLGKSPSGAAYSSFRSMDAVVSALLAHHEGRPGLSERTLWSKLAQARRHLETSR